MKQEEKPDLLAKAAAEASRLGMSYGQFQAMCYQKYPKCPRPISRYFEYQNFDERLAQIQEIQEGEVFRTCKRCGARFPMEGRSHNALYCSSECQYEAAKERAMERYFAKKQDISEQGEIENGERATSETGQESQQRNHSGADKKIQPYRKCCTRKSIASLPSRRTASSWMNAL